MSKRNLEFIEGLKHEAQRARANITKYTDNIGLLFSDISLVSSIDYANKANEMCNKLVDYAYEGLPLGHFLMAVLENDLFEAMGRADDKNRYLVFVYTSFIYNELPNACYGSKEIVNKWLANFSLPD